MEARFTISTWAIDPTDPYTAIRYIASEFLDKLLLLIKPFGYDVLLGGAENWHTDNAEAKKLKKYCRDFQLVKDGVKSREFRIQSKLTKLAEPYIGVLNALKGAKKEFRGKPFCAPGRAYFLGQHTEKAMYSGNTLRRARVKTLTTKKVWYFYVVVNEDMLLVFGGDAAEENANCIYGNYLSFIRMNSLYRMGHTLWLSNGLVGLSDIQAFTDTPLKTSAAYAQIGTVLKVAETKSAALEWSCPRILVLPQIKTYTQRPGDEDFTVFFSNDYNRRSANRVLCLSTIQGINTRPCLVLI